jgi:signal transduction histidine kinase
MHGSIWVESNGIAGEGSIFYVAFPLASQMGDDPAELE